jgi:heme oxygenase
MSTPIMDRLKLETMEAHKRAESQELEKALIKGALPHDLYVEYIAQRYFIHVALEKALQELLAADPRVKPIVTAERCHSTRAVEDLTGFGRDVASLEALPATKAMATFIEGLGQRRDPALVGVFYVFEGSTNGARYISMALRKVFGFEGTFGTRYLDPYGEAQRGLWAGFKDAVNAMAFTEAEQDAMVQAAKDTFNLLADVDEAIYAVGKS